LEKKKVLIVDDEEDVRNLLRDVLDYLGYETADACNGRQALEILSEQDFDLVMADLYMPEMDGLSLLRSIKEESDLPVIIFTGYAVTTTTDGMADLGADGYLRKPFMIQEVEKLVAILCS